MFAGEQKPVLPVSDHGQHELEASLTSPTVGIPTRFHWASFHGLGYSASAAPGKLGWRVGKGEHRSCRIVGGSDAVFCALKLFPVLAGARDWYDDESVC